jgi:DNA-binding MarR family transcriptional regulator
VVKNLEERALIERITDPEDRRRRVLRLTEKGTDMLEALAKPSKAAHDRGLSVFDAGEAKAFIALLTRFIDGHDGP